MLTNFFSGLSQRNKMIVFFVTIFVISLIIFFIFYFVLEKYNITGNGVTKKQNIDFQIIMTNTNDNNEYDLKINNETCEQVDKHKYSCEELKQGTYSYALGKYTGKIKIENEKYAYQIRIDNLDYTIESHDLYLKGSVLQGKFAIKEKYGSHKYSNNNIINGPIKLYRTEIDTYKIKDGIITFTKKWDEISNEYYSNKKLYTEYTVEGIKYKSSKYYILPKNLDINNIFSISYDKNEHKLNINDYLKIDNNLIVYSKNNMPNINLIMLSAKDETDLNGFIKFNLIDIHKDAKINLYFGKNKLLSLFYPNYYVQKNSEDKDSKDFYMMSMHQHEKNVILKENHLIKNIEIVFIKNKDNCKIKATTDNHKPVISTFKCQTQEIGNSILDINFQLNVESPINCSNTKGCILFKVSDIQTGIETNSI